jgi:hypothetical protein
MKHSIVWILFLVVMLLVSLTAVAKENGRRDDCTCSLDMIAGAWGYTETGMQIVSDPNTFPLKLLPYASVGSYTIDPQGNVKGQRTNAQSTAPHQTCIIEGLATINSDCTGTLYVSFSEPQKSTNAISCSGSATKLVVYVDNATEARMIIPFDPISDFPLPGLKAGAVLTTDAKKLFPDSDNPGRHLGNCGR